MCIARGTNRFSQCPTIIRRKAATKRSNTAKIVRLMHTPAIAAGETGFHRWNKTASPPPRWSHGVIMGIDIDDEVFAISIAPDAACTRVLISIIWVRW